MSWLTCAWLFWLGYPVFVVVQFALAARFVRDPGSGKTLLEKLRNDLRDSMEVRSGLHAIRKHLKRLLREGYDGAHVIFSFDGTDAFIQFKKYIHAKGDCGLEMGFPDAVWSRNFFPRLAEWCERGGFACSIVENAQGGGLDFLYVDTGKDVDEAVRLMEGIVVDVFGFEADARFTWRFDGVNELGQEIDDPEARPLAPEETAQHRDELMRGQLGYGMAEGCAVVLVMFVGLLGFTGLEYSIAWRTIWLLSGAEPHWGMARFDLLGVELAARSFEIFCLGLLLIGILGDFTDVRRRMNAASKRHLSEEAYKHRRRRRFRNRYIYLPLILLALAMFWLRG